jgi:hypothetical protein
MYLQQFGQGVEAEVEVEDQFERMKAEHIPIMLPSKAKKSLG